MDYHFSGAELRLARLFNGFALEDVAESIGKSRQYIHKLETNQTAPTPIVLEELARVLRVLPSFFMPTIRQPVTEDQFHFRKLFTTKAGVKQTTMARGEITSRLVAYLDTLVKLPNVRIPTVETIESYDDIELAAELCRKEWGLGAGPISHMSRLAENVGAIVTSFRSVSKEVDALSVAVKRPIIVRNELKESTCRQRFDIAHELGHFVLHAGVVTGDRITENQAHRFAGALLIPRSMMFKLFPRPKGARLDWAGLRDFKLTWKMSKSGSLYRARQLGLITDQQYRSAVLTLKRTGEAIAEKEDALIEPEYPELLKQTLDVLADRKGVFGETISEALNVTPALLADAVGFPLRLSGKPAIKSRPELRLVG